MSLAAGTHLGSYTVVGLLGAGGMGEVYRARDTRLDRDVALKILPDVFAGDPERLARFEREAKTLAALNHPHIAHVYGFEHGPSTSSGQAPTHALVMELVEGEDLSQRIARGPLPLDEALPIARQIVEALDAAHEQRIIHRDLKPANIKVRADGTVKVLDFGLAKALDQVSGIRGQVSGDDAASPLNSPTITTPASLTSHGVILGTAAYMSPEQAKGKPADKRSDIWAFGCVLYEMLTGRRAFDGDGVSDTLAAVLRGEPDWSVLAPDTTPASVRMVVQRCLEKDPKKRVRDMGDVQLALSGAFEVATSVEIPAPPRARRRSLLIAAAAGAAAAAAIATAGWWLLRPQPLTHQPVRFTIAPPASQPLFLNNFLRVVAVSPDGSRVAYAGSAAERGTLMIRSIDRLDWSALRGTEGALFPFFSPDGRWIAFFTEGEIRKVPLAGGPPVTVCRYSAAPRGASWGPDDTIVFATNDTTSGLLSVPADGGQPKTLTIPEAASGEQDHLLPAISPDGRLVFFTISSVSGVESAQIAALDLQTGQRTTLIRGGSDAMYVETPEVEPTGLLVYGSAGTLNAVRFDLARLMVLGDPVRMVDQVVMTQSGAAQYGVSRRGTLMYVSGTSSYSVPRSVEWVSRDGRTEALDLPPRPYTSARLSPDETRVALAVADQGSDIWIYELGRRMMTRLTSDPGLDQSPIWSPDGQRIVFASTRSGSVHLYSQRADGTGGAIGLTTDHSGSQVASSFLPDGRALVFRQFAGSAIDLMLLRFDPAPRVEPLLQTPAVETNGEVSRDGNWIAYQSNEAGAVQVFVRPFPNVEGGRLQISTESGTRPSWSQNGNELFYLDPKGTAMMAVPVRTTGQFRAGAPTKLFEGSWYAVQAGRPYDVSRDGQRFLMIKDATPGGSGATPVDLTVVLNWVEEMKARLTPAQ